MNPLKKVPIRCHVCGKIASATADTMRYYCGDQCHDRRFNAATKDAESTPGS